MKQRPLTPTQANTLWPISEGGFIVREDGIFAKYHQYFLATAEGRVNKATFRALYMLGAVEKTREQLRFGLHLTFFEITPTGLEALKEYQRNA